MGRDTLTGSRIRERRIVARIKQAELARNAGISASYLNLIEHNRRRIGGKLLLDIAGILEVEPSLLSEGAEATLIATLREAASSHSDARPELDRVDEFAGRFPGWANLLAEVQQRQDRLERTVETLTDRLTHDPHLAASMHEVLSMVTAIRSTAAILAEPGEIEPEWRDRFTRNLNEDSQRLAESSSALVQYLDRADDETSEMGAAQDELDAFLNVHSHHFEALENQTAEGRELVANAPELVTGPARQLAIKVLDRYSEDALQLPRADLIKLCQLHNVDPVKIAQDVGVNLDCVMRRLATLPEAETNGPVGLAVCDASGTLTYRKAIEAFPMPRFGASCPLWPLFQAFSRPLVPLQGFLEQTGRDATIFESTAIALPVGGFQANQDPFFEATMIFRPVPNAQTSARPVGSSCRVCARVDCFGRREPSIISDGF